MNALIFLKLKQWKNAIIRAIKTPAKLALIVLYGVMLIFMVIFFVFSPFSGRSENITGAGPGQVVAGIMVLSFVFTFVAVRSGRKGVNRIFTEADAHVLFAAPFRPQSLLIYGLSNQLLTGIFSSVFLLFQFGNFMNFGLRGGQVLVIFVAWILIAFSYALIRVFTYIISDCYTFGKTAATLYSSLALGLVLLSIVLAYRSGNGLADTMNRLLAMPWLRYFPIAGWVGVVIEGLMLGMQIEHWICLLLFILSIPLTFVFVYGRPVDFYEDVQVFAIQQDIAKTNNNINLQDYVKRKKPRNVSFMGLGGGLGANTFFYKHVLEKRRQRKFFLGWAFLSYLLTAVLLSYLSLGLGMFRPNYLPVIYAALFVFMRFTISSINPFAFELTNPYYLLYPISAFERVFYGQLAGLMFLSLDILPGYLLLVIVSRLPLIMAILLFLLLLSSYLVSTAAYLLTYGIAGNPSKGLYALLMMAIVSVFLMPTIIGIVIIGFVIGTEAPIAISSILILIALLLNLAIAVIAVPGMKMIIAKGQDT